MLLGIALCLASANSRPGWVSQKSLYKTWCYHGQEEEKDSIYHSPSVQVCTIGGQLLCPSDLPDLVPVMASMMSDLSLQSSFVLGFFFYPILKMGGDRNYRCVTGGAAVQQQPRAVPVGAGAKWWNLLWGVLSGINQPLRKSQ